MTILERSFSKLKGRTAWITGGKRIGQAVARALAEQGTNIIVSWRSSQKEADEIVRSSKKLGVRALAVRADVSNRRDTVRALDQVLKQFRRIDILVNMASVFSSAGFSRVSEKDMETNVRAHILGTLWPIQLAAPHMPRGSHIINVTDRTSVGRVYKNYLPYVVTKKAVEGLTRTCAVELADRGIFVNAIAPGPLLPPDGTPSREWRALRERSRLKYPMSDPEAVEQFALLVLYLSTVTLASGNTYLLDQGQNL